MISLKPNDLCARCGDRGRVIETQRVVRTRRRPHIGYTLRRFKCPSCLTRWTTYETRLHPRMIAAIIHR